MNRNNKKTLFVLAAFSIVLTMMTGVFSLESSGNATLDENSALNCLNESNIIMEKMILDGFSIIRINDSLKQIYSLYNAQIVLKEKKSRYDFSVVFPYCNEIENVSRTAYYLRDEFEALEKFYNESLTESMDTSPVQNTIDQIDREIKNERYETVRPLIDEAYQEITSLKTSSTTLNLFYKTTTRTLQDFFIENWIVISILAMVAIILLVIYKKTIAKWIIRRKINKLELRKNTLKELIMNTQKSYFEKGAISEGTYSIKTKKFAELIRDIDREIPLLREELLKVDKNSNAENKEDKDKKETKDKKKIKKK